MQNNSVVFLVQIIVVGVMQSGLSMANKLIVWFDYIEINTKLVFLYIGSAVEQSPVTEGMLTKNPDYEINYSKSLEKCITVNCFMDPCGLAKCTKHPGAQCRYVNIKFHCFVFVYAIKCFIDPITVVVVMLGFMLLVIVFNATKILSHIYKTNDNKRKRNKIKVQHKVP
jgi:hypothetical protein